MATSHTIPNFDLFDTGDILLFSGNGLFPSELIEFMTDSDISHVGMVLRNPIIDNQQRTGLYIFESTAFINAPNIENGKYTDGVQINELSQVFSTTDGAIYWRRLRADRNKDFDQVVRGLYKLTYGASYDFDPVDWVKAFFDITYGNEEKEDTFICSALLAFVFDRLGYLLKPVNWTIVRPVDWATVTMQNNNSSRVHLASCELEPAVLVKPNQIKPVPSSGILDKLYSYVSSVYSWVRKLY